MEEDAYWHPVPAFLSFLAQDHLVGKVQCGLAPTTSSNNQENILPGMPTGQYDSDNFSVDVSTPR